MGLLGGTEILVSSVSVNLAGDYAKIPDYLKSLVVGNIITNSRPKSAGDLLRSGYLNGPGVRLRRLYNHIGALGHLDGVVLPVEDYGGHANHDAGVIIANMESNLLFVPWGVTASSPTPHTAEFRYMTRVGPADPYWWALKYICSNEGRPGDDRYYMNVPYWSFPGPDYGWSYQWNEATQDITVTWTESMVSGSLTVISRTRTATFTPSGFDKTKTYAYSYRALQGPTDPWGYGDSSGTAIWPECGIYQMGSGIAAIDAYQVSLAPLDRRYFPSIPIRLNNQFVDDIDSALAAEAKSAFKRVFNMPISKVKGQLAAHPNLADIDHAYVIFGVSADTQDNTCKKYLYRYFDFLSSMQYGDEAHYNSFQSDNAAYESAVNAWIAWNAGGRVGTQPTIPPLPVAKTSSVRIFQPFRHADLQLELRWQYIFEETGTGLKKPDAKVGELWFDIDPTDDAPLQIIGPSNASNGVFNAVRSDGINLVRLHWQETATSWRSMVLVDMKLRNYIYGGKYAEVRLRDALTDVNESGFLFPLHKDTCDQMGLVELTQMNSACCYLMINCYTIVKTGILSGNLLGIFFFVAAIVLTIVLPPAGGILGSNLAVGSAIGLTGMAAVVAGVVINAVAAMIITSIIQKVSVAVFGEKFGAIIGAVVGFVTISVGTGLANGMSMSAIWGSMTSATSLLQLTNAVGTGIAGFIQGAIHDVVGQMSEFNAKADAAMAEVQQAYVKNIGYTAGAVDPLNLTGSPTYFAEDPNSFLTRTLMTGSDIADLSHSMLTDFCDITLTTDLYLS